MQSQKVKQKTEKLPSGERMCREDFDTERRKPTSLQIDLAPRSQPEEKSHLRTVS